MLQSTDTEQFYRQEAAKAFAVILNVVVSHTNSVVSYKNDNFGGYSPSIRRLNKQQFESGTDYQAVKFRNISKPKTVERVRFMFLRNDQAYESGKSKKKPSKAALRVAAYNESLPGRVTNALAKTYERVFKHVEIHFVSRAITYTVDIHNRGVYARHHHVYSDKYPGLDLYVSRRMYGAMLNICHRLTIKNYGMGSFIIAILPRLLIWPFRSMCASSTHIQNESDSLESVDVSTDSESNRCINSQPMVEADTRVFWNSMNTIPKYIRKTLDHRHQSMTFQTIDELRSTFETERKKTQLLSQEKMRLEVVEKSLDAMTCAQMVAAMFYVLGVLPDRTSVLRADPDFIYEFVSSFNQEHNRKALERAHGRVPNARTIRLHDRQAAMEVLLQ